MIDLHTKGLDGHSRSTPPRPLKINMRDGVNMTLILEGPQKGSYRSPPKFSREGYVLSWIEVYGKLSVFDQDRYLSNSPIPDEPAPN